MMITKKRRDASRQRRLVLQKALSVVLSASMTLQGLTYTPVRAYAANEDDVAIDEMYDGSYVDDLATDDQAANGTADDQAVGDAADDQADNQQTDNQQSSNAINDQVTDQQADDQQPVDEQSADEVVIERTADVASAGTAITSLDIVNETTDTVLATATVDNHLIFKVGYEGLEPWSGYSVTVDLLDHRTPEAKAVLMGEPYEVEEDVWEQQPFSWVAPLDTEDAASGIVEIDLEEVDLHWVAGASYPVRVTIADADGNQIVQRVFDGEDDAKLNVPGIGALFTAADGAAEVEATDAAQVTDAVTVTGLPKEAEVTVVGEVVDKDGANVSAGAVDLVADKDGKAEGSIDYPTFDATGLGGTAVSSKLSITVADEDGNDVTVAQFPSAADMAREKEPAPAAVAVRAAAEAEAPKADEPKADDAKVDEPVSAEDESLASVVRSEDGGPEAVVVYGEATEDVEVAREALTLSVTAPEANRIAEKLGNIATDGDINGEHNAPSTSEKVNKLCAGVTSDSQRMGDGISIATFKLQWATQDSPVVDPDPDFNQLNITTTSDGRLSVMTEIDYSISAGGTLFPPDTIHIYVPATLIFKRGGQTMAGRLNIPYAEYPSRLNDYNWRQVDDYVVISNAIPMDGSSAGYIQIEWANVVPHEVVDEDVSAPWYAYIEVDTSRGKTLKATSGNELTAQIDTTEKITAANKRVQTGYPKRVDNDGSVVPTDQIPAEYQNEAEFVVVDWYVTAHYTGNQPFTLDIADALDTAADAAGANPVMQPGFIYKIDKGKGTATLDPNDPAKATATGVYSGWPGSESGEPGYVHVYAAYPFSQFERNVKYQLNNTATYTLTPVDSPDEATEKTASSTATFEWHESSWNEANGNFIIWKWGNDGPTGMVAHSRSSTVSRRGSNIRNHSYQSWYGIYDDGINQLIAEDSDGLSLYYTVYSGGLFIPLTLKKPSTGLVDDNWQWAKWNSATKAYETAESVDSSWSYDQASKPENTDEAWPVNTAQTGGYELVPYKWVLANYLQKPVTVVTEGVGNYFGGTVQTAEDYNQSIQGGVELVAGTDYVFRSVELDKPSVGKIVTVETKESRGLVYGDETEASMIPVVYIQTEVNNAWQQSGNDPDVAGFDWYAKVDWTSGTQVITYKNPAGGESSSVVTLPDNCTNFRTVVKSEGIASFELNAYPELHLLASDTVKRLAEDAFRTGENKVYSPSEWVYNGVRSYGYSYDDEGNITTEPAVRTRFGDDRIGGYTADVAVHPSKKATFDHLKDVNYTTKQVRVHYEAKIEERTFIPDRATYEDALEKGIIDKETEGVWYDLLPKGMVLDRNSLELRDGDTYSRIIEKKNWNGTGRTLVVIPVTLTPTPTTYTGFWADAPTIKFDATMDISTWIDLGGKPEATMEGLMAHNVVAFESSNDTLGTIEHYTGEPNTINQENANNVYTENGTFSDEERAALDSLSLEKVLGIGEDYRTTPSFVYAECSTILAFPTAGRASLSKSVTVDNGASYGTGLYDDVRNAYVGGTYSYRLRMVSSQDTKSKNLVLYDSLETYVPVDGDDEADVNAPNWQGSFLRVDTSALEDAGCAPVVYYSTVANLELADPNDVGKPNEQNIDLTNTSVWSTTCPSDPSDVTAIAIDCRKATDGSDFALLPNESLSAEVVMRAPSGSAASGYVDEDAHAYNDLFLSAYTVEADVGFRPDPGDLDFIHASYTKVGLKKYQVPVEKVWDDDNDRDGMRPDSVTVTLYANGEVAGPDITSKNTLVLNEENEWSGVFEDIPYADSDGNVITYTVRERSDKQPSDVPAGYSVRTTGNATTGYTVTNRHIPVKTSVSGTKTWANDDPETRPAYVDLVLLADGKQVANKRIYPNQDGSWPTHTFTGINKYRDHGIEIVYTVDEIVSDAAYVPTITGEGGAFDILNTYHPYGDVDLTKYVIGATAKVLNEDRAQSKQYQFQVKLEVPITDDEGNPILDDGKQVYGPLAGNYKLESRIGDADATDAGTISDGGTITITAGGSYTLEGVTTQVDPETITIKDLPNNTRVTFTEEDYSDEGLSTATGRVQTVTVTQNKTAKVTYTNVYRTKGQADLEAKKVLKGKTLEASMFNFELLDENGNLVGVQATNKANGTVTFGTIHYTASDDGKTYHYTIREIVPDEAKNVAGKTYAEATDAEKAAGGFKLRGIEYDQSEYGVTVTVNDVDGNGQLTVITKYDKSNAIPKFTNTYAAEGTVELVAWKTLEGRELQADEFSFELVPVSGKKADGTSIVATDIPMPLNDWGVRLSKDTQTNDDQGTVRFDSIKYTQADVGNTYYYVASEVVPTGADPDIEYDTSIFCYKVTIVDNGDGTLYADQSMVDVTKNESSYTIGSATEAQPEFVNKLKPGSLRLEKLIQGENPDPDQEFTFHVILKGDVDPEAFTVEYEEATGDPDQIRTQATRGNEEEEQDSLPAPLQFLHDLFTPTVAYAAEGNIKYSGTFADNLTWEFYEDGELVIRPTNGNDATWYRTEETTPPWLDVIPSTEQSNIKKITFKSTIHVVNTIQDLVTPLWQGNDSIEVLDISGLETSGVRSMRHAFSQLRGLTEIIGIDTLDTSNVGDMYSMFYACPGLTELDVSHFDTSNVRNMGHMFNNCSGLTELDVSHFDTSNVTQMDGMFQWCSSLAMLDVSGFDTSGVTSTDGMNMMFFGCSSLTTLDVSNWDVSRVRNMGWMFRDCSSFTKLDLSKWRTDCNKVSNMFLGCTSLEELDISGFSIAPQSWQIDQTVGNMFGHECSAWNADDMNSSLRKVTLGSSFSFSYNSSYSNRLPDPEDGPRVTGRWMHIDEDGNPIPGHVYTARELASIWNDNRETLAGTWVWEEGDFSIHFDANGGTGSMTDQAVTSDDPFNLDKCEFLSRNPQKTFVGWATSRNGRVVFTDEELVNVTNYYISNAYGLRTYYYSLKNNEGQSCSFVKKSSNSYTFVATLYAVYAPDSYTINYQLSDDDVAEGARGSMRSESAKSGEEHDIAANKFSKKGYYVAGWKVAKVIDQNGSDITSRYSGKTYGLGATIGAKDFMGGDKVTLQPIWKSNGTEPGAEGGEIIVKLKGGEAALIENQLPAGTEYEIWEETPDGWVLVYPGNNDAKGTIVSNETSEETFVNKYDPQPDPDTTITLVAHKLLQNEAGEEQELREGQFRFQLREGTDLAVDPKQTVTNAADGTVTFKPIGYTLDDLGDDESKEFTYTITEVKGSNDNIEYASDPITVTVTVTKGTDPDTGDATLTATAAYSPEDATFVNIVKEPVTHTLTIQKVAEGASADTTFTFEVSLTDAKGQKLPAGTLLTVDGDDAPLATAGKLTVRVMGAGSVTIGNIPNGTQYSVSETSLPNGWAFVSAEGDSGTLQGEEPQAAEATITNEYTPTGKVTFKAYKTFEDSELAAGDFVFELRDPSGTVIQQKENGAPSAGVAPITFDSVELTAAGDYTYTITEVTGNDATIEYDDTEVTASFTMTDNGDGTLTASEVTYSPENATFVNTKKPGELKITKAIEGAAPNASTASFSVVVTFTDAEGTAVAGDFDWTSTTGDSGTVASGGTLTIHGDETITVAGLPGGTHYTAVEDTEAAKSQGFVQSGITGDEGTIAAGAASEVEITNTYLTATTATIKAVKQLEGRKLTEGEFTFHLKDADGNVIAEAENDENGNVTFPELTYSYADEDKTFTYTVSEVVPAEADRVKGMTYDETEHEVTVTIAKGDDGELTAKVNYADDEVPTFVNTYEATGKAKVEVTKELVGADISQAEGQFEFTLARPDGDVLSQAEAKAQAADGAELKATNDASGKVSFREIAYDQDDAGKTYTYVVREKKGKDSGITYDAHACTVRVKVTDNGNGTLLTDVTYGNSTFKNTYNYEPDYGDLEIIKTLKTWENSSVAEDGSGTTNATFVFDVKATLDGEVVYSNAVAVHFNGPGSESAVIKHLPAGASVVVTERYSGATYELKSELEQTTTIVANDMVSVGFKNDYTTNRRGGHGVTNQFTYEGDGKWDNVSVYGGSANAPETQQ